MGLSWKHRGEVPTDAVLKIAKGQEKEDMSNGSHNGQKVVAPKKSQTIFTLHIAHLLQWRQEKALTVA